MTYEESKILDYLKGTPNEYIARRELARKVDRKMYEEDPHWVDAPLAALVDQDWLEQNESGHYKIKKFEG